MKDISTTVDNKILLDEIEKLRASIGGEEQEEDNEKVSRLVEQYTKFKKKNLPNFFFNPEKGTEKYCKWKTISLNHLNQDFFRRANSRIISSPSSDLL